MIYMCVYRDDMHIFLENPSCYKGLLRPTIPTRILFQARIWQSKPRPRALHTIIGDTVIPVDGGRIWVCVVNVCLQNIRIMYFSLGWFKTFFRHHPDWVAQCISTNILWIMQHSWLEILPGFSIGPSCIYKCMFDFQSSYTPEI